jgi:hypothetical protein
MSAMGHVLQHVNIKPGTRVKLIKHTQYNLDVDEINKTVDLLLIDQSTTYGRKADERITRHQFNKLNLTVPWVIITSNSDYFKKTESNIVYYPFFLLDGIEKGIESNVDIKRKRNSLAAYLTHHMHVHRMLTFIQLVKQPWFHRCLVNLSKKEELTESQQHTFNSSSSELLIDEIQEVEELYQLAPITADPTDNKDEIVNIKNKGFTDAYINIMTEADYPANFVTEKSIKPFLSGQIPAVLAHPKVYQHLEELGFDLLSDCINLNTSTLDVRKNINTLMEQIANIEHTIEEKWESSYTRRLHNYNLIRDPALFNMLTSELQHWLNNQGATHNDI